MLNVIHLPNLSPEIFTVDIGVMSFTLRWYAVAYIVGLLSAWQIIVRMIAQPSLWKNKYNKIDIILYLLMLLYNSFNI